jgi:DNA-binding NarL/FixJ family response regulator
MSACVWPFIERRRSDRRKSERRQQCRAGPLKSHETADQCTARERQVVELLLEGMTNKQIAQELRIAEDTVKKHLLHAYRKLGVHRRTLLMLDERMR